MGMWQRFVSVALGVWLTASPKVFGYDAAAATNDYIAGPLTAAIACIAIAEVMRSLRWLTLPLGLWLLATPWVFKPSSPGCVNYMLIGTATVVMAFLGGHVRHRFAGGWTSLWRRRPFGSPCKNH